MRSFFRRRYIRIPIFVIIGCFALYGALLVATQLAMTFKLTDDSGVVDANSRYFQEMHDKYNLNFKVDSGSMRKHRYEVLDRLLLLNDYYPNNAQLILEAYQHTADERTALQMLDAVDLRMQGNIQYQQAVRAMRERMNKRQAVATKLSVFEWMNIDEWKYFKEALSKDRKLIDSAARLAGIESRYIVACIVGEQVRLFNSRRERFKGMVAPLRTLALSTTFSYGVAGIKEHTALRIEQNLKNTTSPYYLGKEYENLLDYDTTKSYYNSLNDTFNIRVRRLVNFDHFYSYLYTALFAKQIIKQWERAGYPVVHRPEIIASLFNLGFVKSVPKPNPEVGGAVFMVRDVQYSFGAIAYEFYFSGELTDVFPYERGKRALLTVN
ncbi:MAG: hypothetical protein FJ211_02085 [Ignavibacteria bacterium]|nr:hypothetical protein [Ignavibacteria bacterium]